MYRNWNFQGQNFRCCLCKQEARLTIRRKDEARMGDCNTKAHGRRKMTEIKEKCGIFGAYSYSGSDVIPLMIAGLRALQHRGQEAWGITTPAIKPHRQKGLVTENLDKSVPILERMTSNAA